ncbi:MAG TPA: aminoglycoside phosphotransferase family protein [Ktedonobacterales bacterium]|nr:aminoglycoside phosphotransferase family protein [Ktedonobacterales bacterium]
MRDKPDIPEERLRACLHDQYGFSAIALDFLPLGLDVRSGIYRAVGDNGAAYLLKARRGPLYEPSLLIPRYLYDQGIASVAAPLATKSRALWADVDEWTLAVYPFIVGESGWRPAMTDAQWQAVGVAVKQIHQATPPAEGLRLPRRETFDPAEYIRWARAFEAREASAEGGSQHERALRSAWMARRPTIHAALASMETLAGALQRQSGPFVICHADLHRGNIIRNQAGEVFLIDWDDVMLAPKERDFLFVGQAPADGTAPAQASAFFQGYGEVAVDWAALTYYLWERVVQDLIECARWVFGAEDVGEEAQADAVRLFEGVFSAGDEVDAALAAAAHLPSHLR